MKILILGLISLLTFNIGLAQFTSKDEYRGTWTENTTWAGGSAPDFNLSGTNENVTIDGFVTLTLPSGTSLRVSSVLTVNASDTLRIIGNLEIEGTGDLIVNGVLVVSGTVSGDGNASIANTGTVVVIGDFDMQKVQNISNTSDNFYVTGNDNGYTGAKDESQLYLEQPQLVDEFITPQPVELLSFEGYASVNSIQLEWVTAMEENFDFFTIERAGADRQFKAIGTMKGKGNSTVEVAYSFTDEAPLQGQSFYRLKATDVDGSIEYHRIISVHFNGLVSATYSVYPNPVSSHNFKVKANQENISEIQLKDLSGRTIFSQQAQPGINQVEIPQMVKAGAYLVVITNISGTSYQQRIMVL